MGGGSVVWPSVTRHVMRLAKYRRMWGGAGDQKSIEHIGCCLWTVSLLWHELRRLLMCFHNNYLERSSFLLSLAVHVHKLGAVKETIIREFFHLRFILYNSLAPPGTHNPCGTNLFSLARLPFHYQPPWCARVTRPARSGLSGLVGSVFPWFPWSGSRT